MDLDTTDGEYLRHSAVEHFTKQHFRGVTENKPFLKTRITSLEKNSICKGTKLIFLC